MAKNKAAKTGPKGANKRRVRYNVATSLDGFIAGPNGDYDWITIDPAIDFAALYEGFDAVLMGRRTFEFVRQGGSGAMDGMETIVFSRTLRPSDHPAVTISTDVTATVSALKAKPGKDIWLFGGGGLFRSLLDAGLVDVVELCVIPILLSEGTPLLPAGARSPSLRLTESKTLPSGTVLLTYALHDK